MLFGKQAETAAEYVKKGQMVYVEGRLQTRSWEDKDGVKRYSTEIVGNSFTMLGRRSVDEGGSSPPEPDDEDLPF